MEAFILTFLSEYGWLAMIMLLLASGVGIPIGEELVNVPAGIFVGQGEMPMLSTFLAAYAGVLGGDFLWFWLCGRYGRRLLGYRWFRRMVHPRRVLQVKHQFDRKGGWVLLIARFIPGTRSPALTIAALANHTASSASNPTTIDPVQSEACHHTHRSDRRTGGVVR